MKNDFIVEANKSLLIIFTTNYLFHQQFHFSLIEDFCEKQNTFFLLRISPKKLSLYSIYGNIDSVYQNNIPFFTLMCRK